MYLRSQKQVKEAKEAKEVQTVADRVKLNPRAAAKEANQLLVSSTVQEKSVVVKKQVVEPVYHRYMLRSMRR